MDLRLSYSFLDSLVLAVYKFPCCILPGIILRSEFLLLAVLLINEYRLYDSRLIFRAGFHFFEDVVSGLVRHAIIEGQMLKRPPLNAGGKYNCENDKGSVHVTIEYATHPFTENQQYE